MSMMIKRYMIQKVKNNDFHELITTWWISQTRFISFLQSNNEF